MSFLWKASFFIIILGLSISTSNLVFAQPSNNSSKSSSNTNLGCAYSLYGSLFHTTGSCPSQGTSTIVSQANGTIPDESLRLLIDYDENLYRETVFAGHQCGGCWNWDVLKSCIYDSNGDFVGGIPLRKPFSDADKAVLLDLNSSYSFPICPFKGKPTPIDTTPTNTIIGSSGSVNVMDLGKNNTQSNATKSISDEKNSQTTNGTTVHYANETEIHFKNVLNSKIDKLSPLKQEESGISIKDVQCKQGFVLVLKTGNGHPVCVKPQTAEKLVKRGLVHYSK